MGDIDPERSKNDIVQVSETPRCEYWDQLLLRAEVDPEGL